jgi:CubicO group peptidase (beta-lactamase class C family)
MMSRRLFSALAGALAAFLPGRAARAAAPDCRAFAGRWGGQLGSGARALRLVLEISAGGVPTLVSVDQGGVRIPVSGGTCRADGFDLEVAAVRGRMQMQLAPDASGTLTGTWSQGPAQPLSLTRLAEGQTAPARPAAARRGPLRDEVAAAVAAGPASALGAVWRTADPAGPGALVTGGLRTPGGAPVTDQDLWHIGSITKSMTGTLLARLVAAGRLSWDTPVRSAVGGPVAEQMHAALQDITLAQLVTGRAGVASNIPMLQFLTFPREDRDVRVSRQRYAQVALSAAPERAPGTGFLYPNSGFVVAGHIAEQATGLSWEELMRTEVFGPLGLTSAGFGPPDPDRAPSGLVPGGQTPRPARGYADNPQVLGPAGTVHMTLPDLARFGAAHLAGATGQMDPYLPQAAWRHLHTAPDGSDYAVGWVVDLERDLLWHNGSNTMWLAELRISPQSGRVAAAAANFADSEDQLSAVLDAAWQEAPAGG